MRRTLLAAIRVVLFCCYAGVAYATDIDGPNDCTRSNRDFGDAPEGTAVLAYPGVPGRFPTCITPGPVGTQTVACPPISTAPGPAGYVMHNSAVGQPLYWLGCPPLGGLPMGIDSEGDGKVNNSAVLGAGSVCSGIATDCVEAAFGLSFGQDECYGSTDAGVLKPNLKVCSPATVTFKTFNCSPTVTVFLNILVDMNHDGDWNDNFTCPAGCAYEWAVKNATITLPSGCATLTSPSFLVGPISGQGWMRVTISNTPANNDFPWAGSATIAGGLQGGETEDYPVNIRKPVVVSLAPSAIDWATTATGTVRFRLRFENTDPVDPSDPATGQIMSQRFGVYQPDFGTIGTFNVPELEHDSFFDVFTEISLDQLPPGAQEVLPWMGMLVAAKTRGTPSELGTGCPPDDHWDGNVDVTWNSPAGGGHVNKHIGTLQVCPAHGNSYIHTLVFCNSPAGASWTITGVCPGWSATLVNEAPPLVPDGPAPNPVPAGWTGYICIAADATVVPGATCPIKVTFICDGVPGTIDMQPVACDCAAFDPCVDAYLDFGDAPEYAPGGPLIPAYPGGALGHFPTCTYPSVPGTQELACQPALSTPPGGTGVVIHDGAAGDAIRYWLGCGPPGGPAGGLDSEGNGKMNLSAVVGDPSSCDPGVLTDCVETAFGGGTYGQDECYGDADAGVISPIEFTACTMGSVSFIATNCGAAADVFLNICVDWNEDGDWNDNFLCGGACAYEWAVKNAPIVLQPGCTNHVSPSFLAGPLGRRGWLRITLTSAAVLDDYPWNGSLGNADGRFHQGETEDYPVTILPGTIGVDERLRPSEVKLGVLPNPSSSSVTVSLALPRESQVALAVYDVMGRKLATLAGGVLPAGEKTIPWNFRSDDGRQLPLGLYLLRADIDGRRYTRMFVRIR